MHHWWRVDCCEGGFRLDYRRPGHTPSITDVAWSQVSGIGHRFGDWFQPDEEWHVFVEGQGEEGLLVPSTILGFDAWVRELRAQRWPRDSLDRVVIEGASKVDGQI